MPGVYKYTTKENADQVANLLQYAWASLSTKEQTLLTARAGKNKKGVDYLLKLLAAGNTSFNTDMEYQDQLNPDGTKKILKLRKVIVVLDLKKEIGKRKQKLILHL